MFPRFLWNKIAKETRFEQNLSDYQRIVKFIHFFDFLLVFSKIEIRVESWENLKQRKGVIVTHF